MNLKQHATTNSNQHPKDLFIGRFITRTMPSQSKGHAASSQATSTFSTSLEKFLAVSGELSKRTIDSELMGSFGIDGIIWN